MGLSTKMLNILQNLLSQLQNMAVKSGGIYVQKNWRLSTEDSVNLHLESQDHPPTWHVMVSWEEPPC